MVASGHMLWAVKTVPEGNLRLPDVALSTVQDDVMFLDSLHQAQEVTSCSSGVQPKMHILS